jgi:5-methylcytosine-specific restriction endonuclease McrA
MFYWPELVASQGKKWKRKMVARKGHQCLKCGYHKCVQGLSFHHINPADKEYEITRGGGKTYLGEKPSLEQLEHEIETKCVLLCHNCHSEVEVGLWTIAELVQTSLLRLDNFRPAVPPKNQNGLN